MKKQKKSYYSVVSGALKRKLIGRNVKSFELIEREKKKFYFFSNTKSNYTNLDRILDKVISAISYSNEGINFVFGEIQMKNGKHYTFICEIDPIFIREDNTSIISPPKTLQIIKKN
ncbi:MAG TPA: hypothetical protein PKX34_02645 [Candidatus Absconditabacterales bacterium]|nr:hypothetical protein [Candidatus Absconditabacterales bacterium]HPK28084.1 hypothetical protein [Candidatus Absconditabacterales bacterium]